MIAAIILVVFPFAMIYAALSDIFSMTIANRVSLILIGSFLFVAPFIGLTWHDFMMHLAAFALVLTITFILFALNTMGGGDAKLLASTSLWMGLSSHLMDYLLMSSIAGGALTIMLLLLRKSSLAVYAGEVAPLRRLVDEKDIPYGVALAFGGMFAFQESPAMVWAISQFAG